MGGASILWFGWFGFNAGSEVLSDGIAVSAWTVTNTATGMASVTWLLMSWGYWKTQYRRCCNWFSSRLGSNHSSIWLGWPNGVNHNRNCCRNYLLRRCCVQELTQMG